MGTGRLDNDNCVWNVTEPKGNIHTLSLVSFQESPSLFAYGDGIKLSLFAFQQPLALCVVIESMCVSG